MVILQFTQDSIKLCESAIKRQGPILVNIAKRPIAGLSDVEVSKAVLGLLNESGVKRRRPLIACIPRHLFTVRNLRLPSVEDTELRAMAGLQAGKQLPYPANELLWDFRTVEKRQDGYSDVSLLLGHRAVVDRFVTILKNAGLEAERIILSSEALLGWYLAASGFKDEEEPNGQLNAVVDIDTSYVDIVILKRDILEYSRCFPAKGQPQETVEELRKTFYSYEKESSRAISSVVLTGIEEKAQAVKTLFEDIGQDKPAALIHPLKVVSLDYRETFTPYRGAKLDTGLTAYFDASKEASFSCVLGIAYNLAAMKMDFLPPEIKTEKARRQKRRLYTKTGLLAALLCLVLFGIFAKGIIDRKMALDLLNLKLIETEPKVKQIKEQYQNIEIIRRSLNMKGSCVDVMREVFKIAPQEVSISVLDFELDKSLVVRGVSSNLSDVFRFASELKKSNYFERSEIKYAQKRIAKEKEFIDFELECSLRGGLE